MSLGPNQRQVRNITWGVARQMWADSPLASIEPRGVGGGTGGGGNLNGSRNNVHMIGQAGTGMDRLSLPRKPMNSNNYCGVI